jgi:hypothetical protein
MVPFDPLVGEFHVHYAGFFDPGFGFEPGKPPSARGVPEPDFPAGSSRRCRPARRSARVHSDSVWTAKGDAVSIGRALRRRGRLPDGNPKGRGLLRRGVSRVMRSM